MKRVMVVVLGLFALSCGGGGGSSSIPQADACNQAAKAACPKVFGCTGGNFTLVQAFLTNESACEATVIQDCSSIGFQCTTAQTYHGDQAGMCRDQFKAEDCATLNAAITAAGLSATGIIASLTATIPACGMICTSN